jgi:hypothetical protein
MYKIFLYSLIATVFSTNIMAATGGSTPGRRARSASVVERETMDAAIAASLQESEAAEGRRRQEQEETDAAIAAMLAAAPAPTAPPTSPRGGAGSSYKAPARVKVTNTPIEDYPRRGGSATRRAADGTGRAISPACRALGRAVVQAACPVTTRISTSSAPSLCEQLHRLTLRCDANAQNPGFTDKEVFDLWPYADGRL